jgi:hypothetical protein
MLTMAAFYDDDGVFCGDEQLSVPKRTLVDDVVALAQRVILGIVVRAPRVVATRQPPSHEGGAEVHEVLVRGFIALRSHSEVLGAEGSAPSRGEGPREGGRRA